MAAAPRHNIVNTAVSQKENFTGAYRKLFVQASRLPQKQIIKQTFCKC